MQKEMECLLNLGEPPTAIIDKLQSFLGLLDLKPQTGSPEPAVYPASPGLAVNHASPGLAVNHTPSDSAINDASPEPTVNHASPFSVNDAAKSGTPMDCAKTNLATKVAKLECKPEPKDLSNISKTNSSFLEIFDDVQNTAKGSPENVEDYNFDELSEFYFQGKHVDDDADSKTERKRRRTEGPHLHKPFSMLSDQSMSMVF